MDILGGNEILIWDENLMTRKINDAGLDLIKCFESCVLHSYKDPVGLLTIGWGHLIKAGETFPATIDQKFADDLLEQDLEAFEHVVENLVKVEITDNEFAALVSLTFNIGPKNFAKSSLLGVLNNGNKENAANRFSMWNKARNAHGQLVELKGLTRRRLAERDLFLLGV